MGCALCRCRVGQSIRAWDGHTPPNLPHPNDRIQPSKHITHPIKRPSLPRRLRRGPGEQQRALLHERHAVDLEQRARAVLGVHQADRQPLEVGLDRRRLALGPDALLALGVVLLSERLRRVQWVAIGIACIAVLVLTISYGGVPWISLVLAFSFGTYGLLKKRANVEALPSLAIETAVFAPFALAYLLVLEVGGQASFVSVGWETSLLLILLGPVTALPLLAFGAAAIRIPLSTLGVIQYMTPIGQFLLGVTVFGESMPALRWIGFILVWVALVMFTVDAWRRSRMPVVVPD